MNTHIKNLFLLPLLITGLGVMVDCPVTAQVFTTLHPFTGFYGDGGSHPQAGLLLSGNILYGTAPMGIGGAGPIEEGGIVFSLNGDGRDYTDYDGGLLASLSGLILSGNILYGTQAPEGVPGSSGILPGIVFSLNSNGTAERTIYTFPIGGDAADHTATSPVGGVILWGSTLYGTTSYDINSSNGTVFAVNTDGTGFTNLYSFTATSDGTNSDGAEPKAGLILSVSGNTLYGTASQGGSSGNGTLFKVNTDGTGFTTLHSFSGGRDGGNPVAALALSGNILYGTAEYGGSSSNGTIFAVNIDGTGFTVLHSFTATPGPPGSGQDGLTNSDGAYPVAPLIVSGNTLFGTAQYGGISGNGSLFALNADGTGFSTLHSFTATDPSTGTNIDGVNPVAGLILSGNTVYGTAIGGGSSGYGTVFSISFPPQLTLIASGANPILTWPTNYLSFDYTGYHLQSSTNLSSPAWTPVSPSPVVIGGQKVVVNPISGTQQFFRLSQ